MLSLKDFDFELPHELIAQAPARPRDHARMLVYDRSTGRIHDDYFYHLLRYLPGHTTIAVNNSKVEKCRLRFDGMELFVLETMNDHTLRCMVKPGKRFRLGDEVALTRGVVAKVTHIEDDGLRTIVLNVPLDDPLINPYRLTPLPPYIGQDENLSEEYQTVYANPLGSKAAPTAGLHFTDHLLGKVKQHHAFAQITLHVGLGTFAPVKTDSLADHHMHSEWYEITPTAADLLNRARHTTAVGTTTVRTLETAARHELHVPSLASGMRMRRRFEPHTNNTDIFITPGYQFKAVDALITNFHLPKSTLLMLVAAFLGSTEELHRIYKHAINEQYRFYSFGDAMLVL